MKWCRFEREGSASYGIVDGDRIIAVDGTPWGEHRKTAASYPLSSSKLLIPVMPPNFLCAGINYAEHVRLMAAKRGVEPDYPKRAEIGYRSQSALCAHDEPIVKPKESGPNFQYEGELVAVFGKRARKVSKENALDYVFGWTIGNDVSERDWQSERGMTWDKGKGFDTFGPLGPWLVTPDEIADVQKLGMWLDVNGARQQTGNTADMIFGIKTIVS